MKIWQRIILILLSLTCLIFLTITFFLWQKIKSFKPVVYYTVPAERFFVHSPKEDIFRIEEYLKEVIEKEMQKLKREKANFVYVNLKKMEIILYKEGEEFEKFPVAAKGAEWFWGETPSGVYYADNKFRLAFSSMARVWMPYAIQFFGSYFIHGWPYDARGRLVTSRVSGGCIRLKTDDAAKVFDFVDLEMPILIFDEKPPLILPALKPVVDEIVPPVIQAKHALIADLDTGEIILDKEANSQFYAGLIINVMLALVAAESINLEKRIVAEKWMFKGIKEGIIVPGKSYSGYELLSPLLLKSSKEAALVLSRFRNPEIFLDLMQKKAKGLGLKDTFLVDLTGESLENKTTLYDVARLFCYLKNYRKFILNISSQILGRGENGGKTKFILFKMKYRQDEKVRSIFVGLANSHDVESDLKNIEKWLKENFELVKI